MSKRNKTSKKKEVKFRRASIGDILMNILAVAIFVGTIALLIFIITKAVRLII